MSTGESSTAELLLLWDQRRARSRQTELGMSEVGGCRRRAGYRLAGTEPSNAGGSVRAVIGTAIHTAVADALRGLQAEGRIPAGDLIEHEVRYAGVLGHLDRYHTATATVEDTKTVDARRLGKVKVHGPSQSDVWQVHLYAAGLIKAGYPVAGVALDFLARDSGESWRWERRFDVAVVRDALEWLDAVRSTEVEMLNRDYPPDSAWCQHCPFQLTCWGQPPAGRDPRVVLFAEDPDAAKWAQRLMDARADKADAVAREDEAKGALDAVRPDGADPVDVGLAGLLRWQVRSSDRLDADAVRADYAEAGLEPPTKRSTSVVLEFVAREPGDLSINDGQAPSALHGGRSEG